MVLNEKQRAAEQRFIEQQRTTSCKTAFTWFIKRLILFIILIVYTVIGAYLFQVNRFHPAVYAFKIII